MSSQADGVNICQFIDNLDRHHKVVLLLGGLCLPFDNVTYVNQEIYSRSIGNIQKLRRERLRERAGTMVNKESNPCITVFYHYVVVCLSFLTHTDFKIDWL